MKAPSKTAGSPKQKNGNAVEASPRKRAVSERTPIESREQWLNLRKEDVTASAAGALLGVHEYMTPYALWALKSGLIAEDPEETPVMQRGRRLEPVAIDLIRDTRPNLSIEKPHSYFRDPVARLGATPDALCTDAERGVGVIQIKTVEPSVFRRKWRTEDGTIEPPLWIAVQAIVEAYLTGAQWAAVAAMRVGYGLDLDLIEIPIHGGLIGRIEQETAAFWRSVESGKPPDPDYRRDGETIALLNQPNDTLPPIDLSGDNAIHDLVAERESIGAREKTDKERRKAIDAEVTTKLAGHTVGLLADGRRITRKLQRRGSYMVKETSFPVIRVLGGAA